MYKKLKEPRLVDFSEDIEKPCGLKYYDNGLRTNDSGQKCKSRSKRKDEVYCSQHDCPFCECPTLEEIKSYDKSAHKEIRDFIIKDGGDIKDFDGVQPNQLPCGTYGSEWVIQYYEVL